MKLRCEPIGIIRTHMRVKFDAPHQPTDGVNERNIIELFPDRRLEDGLKDLEGFERIWLIWWFDRNKDWNPLVTPPRGPAKRRGVFATRSPHRPCPIGMTAVPLISISGRTIVVGNSDLLDNTPILDIKPYISQIDSFPNQKQGWLDEVEGELVQPVTYTVTISQHAQEQREWLQKNWRIDFLQKAVTILERTPERSRTHRITAPKDGVSRLSSGSWRVYFSVREQSVEIIRIAPGFPRHRLLEEGFEVISDWEAQLQFLERWAEE